MTSKLVVYANTPLAHSISLTLQLFPTSYKNYVCRLVAKLAILITTCRLPACLPACRSARVRTVSSHFEEKKKEELLKLPQVIRL